MFFVKFVDLPPDLHTSRDTNMATEAEAKIEDGGPAFPGTIVKHMAHELLPDGTGFGRAFPVLRDETGMSLRDWFAGQVLSNMDFRGETPARAADWSYSVADAMLAARKAGA